MSAMRVHVIQRTVCFLNGALGGARSACFRPRIANALRFALVLWAGAAVSYSVSRIFDVNVCLVLSLAFLMSAFTCGIAWAAHRRAACIWIAALAAGMCLGFTEASILHDVIEYPPSFPAPLTLNLIEDVTLRDDKCVALAQCETLDGKSVTVEVTFGESPGLLLFGDTIVSASSMEIASGFSEYAWSRGVVAQVSVYSFEVESPKGVYGFLHRLRQQALEVLSQYGGKQAGLLQALVCGYRGGVDASGEYVQYQIIGLAHIIAVSGSHLAIVALFVNAIARLIGLPARFRVMLVVLFVAAYLVFSGCSVSAARSVLMVAVALTSLFAGRRASSQNALAICIIGFIAADPKTAVSVSFILSAGSTLGIILFGRLVASWFPKMPHAAQILIVEPLSLTFASGLATQLYAAALFSQFPLISPVANLLAAPLFSVGTIAGLFGVLLACLAEVLAPVLVSCAAIAVVPLQIVCDALSGVTWACVPFEGPQLVMVVVSVVLCACVYQVWPDAHRAQRSGMAAAVFLLLFAMGRGMYLAQLDEIIVLDVGQGDSLVVRSGGCTVLVDTGNRPALLREALARNGVYSIDAVIVTHADDDHCGALGELANTVSVKAVYFAEGARTCSCDSCTSLVEESARLRGNPDVGYLLQGDLLNIGEFSAEVVWPKAYVDEGGNADSLCLLLEHGEGGWLSLLTGDVEAKELSKILQSDDVGDVDVLKVGHHGSSQAVTHEILESLQPEISLISVGEGNWYGHPDVETLAALEKAGSQIFRTDLHGDIRICFSQGRIKVLA